MARINLLNRACSLARKLAGPQWNLLKAKGQNT